MRYVFYYNMRTNEKDLFKKASAKLHDLRLKDVSAYVFPNSSIHNFAAIEFVSDKELFPEVLEKLFNLLHEEEKEDTKKSSFKIDWSKMDKPTSNFGSLVAADGTVYMFHHTDVKSRFDLGFRLFVTEDEAITRHFRLMDYANLMMQLNGRRFLTWRYHKNLISEVENGNGWYKISFVCDDKAKILHTKYLEILNGEIILGTVNGSTSFLRFPFDEPLEVTITYEGEEDKELLYLKVEE